MVITCLTNPAAGDVPVEAEDRILVRLTTEKI
jgi:hypothetical protein